MIDTLNNCYYSKGSQHELCTHKNWCIFQESRIITEQQIVRLTRQLFELEKQYNHQKLNGGDIMVDEKQLQVLKEDISRLEDYERRMV